MRVTRWRAGAAVAYAIGAFSATAAAQNGYDTGGRRDPFVSLLAPKASAAPRAAAAPVSRPGAGLAGIAVSDVRVRGVMRSGNALVALLEGPDGKTFLARREDRLMNGLVKTIEQDAVIFSERVADAAGAVRQRDVKKVLRPAASSGGLS
jgi:Tfp pilus assembly protein PilP